LRVRVRVAPRLARGVAPRAPRRLPGGGAFSSGGRGAAAPRCDRLGHREDSMLELKVDPAPLEERYRHARPFPHIVLDGLFADAALDAVLASFPRPGEIDWVAFDNPTEKKLGYTYKSR